MVTVATLWPENSEQYWEDMEKREPVLFERQSLWFSARDLDNSSLNDWGFWERVSEPDIIGWMNTYRLITMKTDLMRRSMTHQDEMWNVIRDDQCPWDDPRYERFF